MQKGFLTRDQAPSENEVSQLSGFIPKLGKYSDLEVSIIRKTKIHKVLKMIVKLSNIPHDEVYHVRQRAIDILSQWKNVLDSDTAGPAEDKEEEVKPKENGLQKEESEDLDTKEPEAKEDKAEKEEEPKPAAEELKEPADVPMTDADTTEKTQAPEPAKENKPAEAEKPAEEKTDKPEDKTEERAEEKPEEKTEEKPAEVGA